MVDFVLADISDGLEITILYFVVQVLLHNKKNEILQRASQAACGYVGYERRIRNVELELIRHVIRRSFVYGRVLTFFFLSNKV